MKKFLLFLLCVFMYIVLLYLPAPENLGKRIDKLSWVKPGGCGYVAYYLSDYLDSIKVNYQIIQIGFGKYKNIHYMIRVGDSYLDKNGSFSKIYPLLLLPHRVIRKDNLRILLNDSTSWNKKFNLSDTTLIHEILN